MQRPLRLTYKNLYDRINDLLDDSEGTKVTKKDAEYLNNLKNIEGLDEERTDEEFFAYLGENGMKRIAAGMVKKLRGWLGNIDENAPKVYEKPGDSASGLVPDTNLSDTESIPMKQDIEEYFEREVLKFVPDAWMDRSKDKVGCEFPFTKLFYRYKPLRSSEEILTEFVALDKEMDSELYDLKNE